MGRVRPRSVLCGLVLITGPFRAPVARENPWLGLDTATRTAAARGPTPQSIAGIVPPRGVLYGSPRFW
jgi:hypothetical protein